MCTHVVYVFHILYMTIAHNNEHEQNILSFHLLTMTFILISLRHLDLALAGSHWGLSIRFPHLLSGEASRGCVLRIQWQPE